MDQRKHTVIVGGGFGGLEVALGLRGSQHRVTLIDRSNYHLFQPLLYQVATGGLSPGDISSPLRAVLKKANNITVLMGEVTDIRVDESCVLVDAKEIRYDCLVVAAGVRHHYFGNSHWEKNAPGLKTTEDALDIRRRILRAFEAAERTDDHDEQRAQLNFVIVGGGPTGVELAGAIGELANKTLESEFRNIDPSDADITIVEGAGRILPSYAPDLSAKAARSLHALGVTTLTNALVTSVDADGVDYKIGDASGRIDARTVLWAAGIQGSPLGKALTARTDAQLDNAGRVVVEPDLRIDGHDNVFVVGDLAACVDERGEPLPGVAQVAMQQGRYVARRIKGEVQDSHAFRYKDKGSLAVIGRNAAVAQIGRVRMSGFAAWLLWVFIHIAYLIEYDNRILVLTQWAINYFTRKRGARLITNEAAR